MLRDPEQMNWGMNQVSQVVVIDDSTLAAAYDDEETTAVHVAFQWEPSDPPTRQIDVVASGLTISPNPGGNDGPR